MWCSYYIELITLRACWWISFISYGIRGKINQQKPTKTEFQNLNNKMLCPCLLLIYISSTFACRHPTVVSYFCTLRSPLIKICMSLYWFYSCKQYTSKHLFKLRHDSFLKISIKNRKTDSIKCFLLSFLFIRQQMRNCRFYGTSC